MGIQEDASARVTGWRVMMEETCRRDLDLQVQVLLHNARRQESSTPSSERDQGQQVFQARALRMQSVASAKVQMHSRM